jgi:hypothetical protein
MRKYPTLCRAEPADKPSRVTSTVGFVADWPPALKLNLRLAKRPAITLSRHVANVDSASI